MYLAKRCRFESNPTTYAVQFRAHRVKEKEKKEKKGTGIPKTVVFLNRKVDGCERGAQKGGKEGGGRGKLHLCKDVINYKRLL